VNNFDVLLFTDYYDADRYILDGDREELRSIRNDLATLKLQNIVDQSSRVGRGGMNRAVYNDNSGLSNNNMNNKNYYDDNNNNKDYHDDDNDDGDTESKVPTSPDSGKRKSSNIQRTVAVSSNKPGNNNTISGNSSVSMDNSYHKAEILVKLIESLRNEIKDLLATGIIYASIYNISCSFLDSIR